MRVLCLINGLASGGAQRQLVGLADLMIKKGVEVKVIYYRSEHFYVPLSGVYIRINGENSSGT